MNCDLSANSVSFVLSKYRILSGSALKTIALVTMIIDHVASHLLSKMASATVSLFNIESTAITVYWICCNIGRIAFSIYSYLLTEGYINTHDKFKYGRNLLIFALILEIPWNLEHADKVFLPSSQDVFFTLFLGYLAICFWELYKEKEAAKHLVYLMIVFVAACFIKADYALRSVSFILLVFLLRELKPVQALIRSSFFTTNALMVYISFIIINLYNGERGYYISQKLLYADEKSLLVLPEKY